MNKTKRNRIIILGVLVLIAIIVGIVVLVVLKENTVVAEEHIEEIAKAEAVQTIYNLNIGDYIDYSMPSAKSYTASSTYSGANSKTYTSSNLKWRVLSKDTSNNRIEIISEREDTANNFSLSGYKGYNNGVKLLDDTVNGLYLNEEKGAVSARNLKIEDIEAHYKSGVKKASNREVVLNSSKYYPQIFAQEANGSIGSSYGSLARSSQTSYISQSSALSTSTLKGKINFYGFTMSTHKMDNQGSIDLLSCEEGKYQWLSSRCYDVANNTGYFALSYVTGSYIGNRNII